MSQTPEDFGFTGARGVGFAPHGCLARLVFENPHVAFAATDGGEFGHALTAIAAMSCCPMCCEYAGGKPSLSELHGSSRLTPMT